jgi:hypothetical protein
MQARTLILARAQEISDSELGGRQWLLLSPYKNLYLSLYLYC